MDVLSVDKLRTCCRSLQLLVEDVSRYYNVKVLWGWRSQKWQDDAFARGTTKLKWPDSKHNFVDPETGDPCSLAVDITQVIDGKPIMCVEPTDWSNKVAVNRYHGELRQLYFFSGGVLICGLKQGLKLRWGGDWNSDLSLLNNKFNDLFHWELVL
ncbi:hypothetical protein C4561_01485 [candidate division WWE3 bacterium]|uniref:Peptidase M15C domain-containing protein n=1 Tax=candidate division WWE3 bacterium TaxID=2053526 RepID=A0A3A4ZEZ9_UNCKA|nr:MAG: hypothetical protein C4561_01485 [candidate division WWE3 bacterium]